MHQSLPKLLEPSQTELHRMSENPVEQNAPKLTKVTGT